MEILEWGQNLWKRRRRSNLVGHNNVSWTNQPRSEPACDRHYQREKHVSALLARAFQHKSPSYKCKDYKLEGDWPYAGRQLIEKVSWTERVDRMIMCSEILFCWFIVNISTISQHQSRILMMLTNMIMSLITGNLKNINDWLTHSMTTWNQEMLAHLKKCQKLSH